MYDLIDFISPVNNDNYGGQQLFNDEQLAKHLATYRDEIPDIGAADILLAGTGEYRGMGEAASDPFAAADAVRKELYPLHYWHSEVKVADIGNIRCGASLYDSYASIKTVVGELLKMNKTIVLIGGSHDLTLAQYHAYRDLGISVEVSCIDAKIDLRGESKEPHENFLLELLTSEPNWVKSYNHIGFQSYFVHPGMLETMDRLHFDCTRLGKVKEDLEEMEPVIRNTHLMSIDISAIKNSDAPANTLSPNGFNGEEICTLTRFAGMSAQLSSMGIFGYRPETDRDQLTAKQIAQMLWYFIDGKNKQRQEAPLDSKNDFNEFTLAFAEFETHFLQSRKTGRWWMKLPGGKIIACSKQDYLSASKNEIPERWFRAVQRTT
jgi:arginase family enzyme